MNSIIPSLLSLMVAISGTALFYFFNKINPCWVGHNFKKLYSFELGDGTIEEVFYCESCDQYGATQLRYGWLIMKSVSISKIELDKRIEKLVNWNGFVKIYNHKSGVCVREK